jgi:hypothetical protein
MRTDAPINNRKKILEKDAQKNPRKKTIREQQMHRKNPENKLY